jgi:hypothetical protein
MGGADFGLRISDLGLRFLSAIRDVGDGPRAIGRSFGTRRAFRAQCDVGVEATPDRTTNRL